MVVARKGAWRGVLTRLEGGCRERDTVGRA